jgi:hypothetical protein
MADSVLCQSCGIEAPLKYVRINSNIGMLVARRTQYTRGFLCRPCIQKQFWKHTLTNVTLGWWGMISIVVTPIYIVTNLATYIASLQMKPPAPDAMQPYLNEQSRAKLQPVGDELIKRLNQKQAISDIAAELAARTGVTPGQVVLYARELVKQPRQASAPSVAPLPVAPALASEVVELAEPEQPLPPPASSSDGLGIN